MILFTSCSQRLSTPPFPLAFNFQSSKKPVTDINGFVVKAFRNLVSGEDDELATAYSHFHKMVEQEQGAIRNASLAAVEQLKQETGALHTDVKVALATTNRTDGNTKALMASTGRIHNYVESKAVSGCSSFKVSKAI